ncbi:cache domain-containing protein [Streptomyces sp. PA03-1a]|nr:cache domain-containing protein [Streptomyces sp. PA03-1a]
MAVSSTALVDSVVADVVDRVRGTLEDVFAAVAQVAERTTAIAAVRAAGRAPTTADLAALRPLLHERLRRRHDLISGIGFIAEPGLLGDVPAWLEWWQNHGEDGLRPLLPDLDPGTSAYSDYTHWDWFALPRATGERAVAGPYVDYLCSDEYSLTLSVPVQHGGRFLGVAAADVYLRHFEAAVLPLLRRLSAPAALVNARGRVAASTDPRHLAGSLLRSVSGRSCGPIPLTLVTALPAPPP